MLSLLRESSLGGVLYEDFYSQYGPAYHWTWNRIFQLLGLSYTHNNGRLATLTCWVASSFITGLSTWRITKNYIAGIGSTVAAFSLLRVLVSEPMHPLGLLSVVLSLLCFSTTMKSHSSWRNCIMSGAIVTMGAIKINFGVLGLLAIFIYNIQQNSIRISNMPRKCNSGLSPWHRITKTSVIPAAGILVLPFMLTVNHPKTAVYATISALLVVLSGYGIQSQAKTDNKKALPLCFLFCIAVVITKAYQGGITLQSLIYSIIIRPLSQPEIFTIPLSIGKSNLAVLALGIALWIWSKGKRDRLLLNCNILVKRVLSICFIAALVTKPLLVVPLLWLGVGDDTRELPLLSSLIFFTIYPVAGSQIGPAILLIVPIAFYIAVQLVKTSQSSSANKPMSHPPLSPINSSAYMPIIAVAALVSFMLRETITAKRSYERNSQLDLRGANMIRIPSDQASHLTEVSRWIDKNCKLFYGLPGLNSFYIFADRKLPGRQSGTAWMRLLNNSEQQSVINSMESVGPTERCLIVDENMADLWNQGRPMPSGPLIQYLKGKFVYVDKIDGTKLYRGLTK